MRPWCIDSSRRTDDEGARANGPLRPAPSAPAPVAQALASPVTVRADTGRVYAVAVAHGDGAGRGRRVVLRFGWDPADPLAVRIEVEARPDHPALPRGTWVVLRDFLRYGLVAPTGDGDVRIHPDDLEPVVWLTLARRTRPCLLAVPAALLTTFLDRTEESVPCGEERSDLDAVIEQLLRS